MIYEALDFLKDELNTYAAGEGGLVSGGNDYCDIGHIWSIDFEATEPFVMLTLVNVEEDRIAKSQEAYQRVGDKIFKRNPAIPVNLYCLFSARNTTYASALKDLAAVIRMFQGKNVFTPANSNLDEGIEKLIVDIQPMSFDQMNQLWGYNGSKYYPSVLYKVRMVIIDQGYEGESGIITNIEITESKV